jgi:hypothetical protein
MALALALAANTIVMFGGIITKDHYDDEHKKSEIQQFEPNPSDFPLTAIAIGSGDRISHSFQAYYFNRTTG